jgi:hypothetical protein
VSDLDKYSDEMTENEETTEATGAASAGAFSSPLFTKEETKEEEKIPGGLSKNKTLKDIAKKHDKKGYNHIDDMLKHLKSQLMKGIKVEMEHTNSVDFAMEIAKDHLFEDPNYYDNLKKIEENQELKTKVSNLELLLESVTKRLDNLELNKSN